MSRSKDGPRPKGEDLLAAAVDASCRQWEKQTGTQREVMLAKMDPAMRSAAEEALEHHRKNMNAAGRAGW